jgi:hypothetical protein
MAKGFDELITFLLDEVALRFAEGESKTALRIPDVVIWKREVYRFC